MYIRLEVPLLNDFSVLDFILEIFLVPQFLIEAIWNKCNKYSFCEEDKHNICVQIVSLHNEVAKLFGPMFMDIT